MAGPLDILRRMGGAAGTGRSASPALPAYSDKDASMLKIVEKRMQSINKAVKEGKSNWNQMADARSLEGARDALKGLKIQQKAFNKVMKDGNATLKDRIKAYDKLANASAKSNKAQEDTEREINESRGAVGRFKNVLDDLAKYKGFYLLTAAVKDLNMVFGDMNQHLDIMARSGQLTDTTFGSLAKTTAMYSGNMRLAMIQSSLMGVSADDSNKAFAQLTETFGGTLDVATKLRENWFEMSQLARASGLGMADVAGIMSQGFKRLGEDSETSLNNIAHMAKETERLTQQFGKGKINTKEFSAAVQTLAYSTGFYNQNTRMVIDTLSREISAQLALGKSRTAATESAVENLKMAGNVNIVGIEKFRKEITGAYNASDDKAAYLAKLTDDFGSEGELIASMLERGTLNTQTGLFAFENIVKGSTKLQSSMLENMRITALTGPQELMAMGVDFGKALRMEAESNLMADKLQAIARGDQGAAEKLFTGDKRTEEQNSLIAELKKDPQMGRVAMLKKFYTTGGADEIAEKAMEGSTVGDPEWKRYVSGKDGLGWFLGMTNIMTAMSDLIRKMPSAFGLVLGGLILRKMMTPGMGAGGVGGMLKGAGGRVTAGLGSAAKILGPLAVIGAQIYAWGDGMSRAAEIMGKSENAVTLLDRVAAGAANAVSQLTLGIVDAGKLARGETLLQRGIYAASAGLMEKGLGLIGRMKESGTFLGFGDANVSEGKRTEQEFENAKKMGWTTAGTLAEYTAESSDARKVFDAQHAEAKGKEEVSVPTQGKGESTPEISTAASAGSGGSASARATASTSGGRLILEVENFDAVLAQVQNDQTALQG